VFPRPPLAAAVAVITTSAAVCGGGGGCAGGIPLGAVLVLSWCGEVSLGGIQSSSSPPGSLEVNPRGGAPRLSRLALYQGRCR